MSCSGGCGAGGGRNGGGDAGLVFIFLFFVSVYGYGVFVIWVFFVSIYGSSVFVIWVLISILLGFRPKITSWFRPAQPITRATGFNSNIRSVVGPFSVHPIRLGRLQVNHKPNLTRLMESPWLVKAIASVLLKIQQIIENLDTLDFQPGS